MSPTNRWVLGQRLRPPGATILALTPHGVVLGGTGGADVANTGASNRELFVYTGEAHPPVPRDVVRVRVDRSVELIPNNAFMDCLNLEHIELPDGVREIGDYAFAFCLALKRITIPFSVVTIHKAVFWGCESLSEVKCCEAGLREIGGHSFANCFSLKRVKVPSTVAVIGEFSFSCCESLKEVDLLEGLEEIKRCAFLGCRSLRNIKMPDSVTMIGEGAFAERAQISSDKFGACDFPKFRIPPLVTKIAKATLSHCVLFSAELSESVREIESGAFEECRTLRNIAIPCAASAMGSTWSYKGDVSDAFLECADLKQLFGPDIDITSALKHRFDELPIHKLLYYQSYNCVTVKDLNEAIDIDANLLEIKNKRRLLLLLRHASKCTVEDGRCPVNPYCANMKALWAHIEKCKESNCKFPHCMSSRYVLNHYRRCKQPCNICDPVREITKNGIDRSKERSLLQFGRQDCLGMTPLHVLACSTTQNLEFYRVIVEKHPKYLVLKDKWGTLAILYVVWGRAPNYILQFLVDTYHAVYPRYDFDWSNMLQTLGRSNAPLEVIQSLLRVQQKSFPRQIIDWEDVLAKSFSFDVSMDTFCSLVKCSITTRLNVIGIKKWREEITNKLQTKPEHSWSNCRSEWLSGVESKLQYYELEYQKLKEVTLILELALWRAKVNENKQYDKRRRQGKREKIDELSVRKLCRDSCGAGVIIGHVLPFLF